MAGTSRQQWHGARRPAAKSPARVAARVLRAVATRRHRDDPACWLASARTIMRSTTYCVLVSSGAAGPSARTVQLFRADENLTVYLGTDPTSRKAEQLAASREAILVYQHNRDRACVVAYCEADILDDRDSRHRYFMPMWRAFWPGGPDEANFVAVRCMPYALEIWDARRGVTPEPFGLRSARLIRTDDGTWRAD